VEPFPWVHVLGQGPGARILVVRADQFGQRRTPSLTVLDTSLNETARVDASPVAEQLHALARGGGTLSHRVGSWLPYVGPLPGGLQDGRDAFLMAGVLVTLDAAGAIETAPASPLSGRHPLGVAGPEGSWMLLATGWAGSRVEATLRAADASGVATLLVPMSDVLPADPDADGVDVTIEGGVIVDHRGVSRLLTSEEGATATISGPPGSVVIGAVDATVVAAMEVGGDPVTVDLAPRRASEGTRSSRPRSS
jgi:hypothetical protein